jgi:serine/threonine protein kinase
MTSHVIVSRRSCHGCGCSTPTKCTETGGVRCSNNSKKESEEPVEVPQNQRTSLSAAPGLDAVKGVVQGTKEGSSDAQLSYFKRKKFHVSPQQATYDIGTIYQSNFFQEFAKSTDVVEVGHHNLQNVVPQVQSRAIRYQWAIGHGSFGAVYLVSIMCLCCYGAAELMDGTLAPVHSFGRAQSGISPNYVIKQLPHQLLEHQKNNASPNKELKQRYTQAVTDLLLEVHVLAGLNHPHIIKVRGVASEDTSAEEFFFLMDRLSCTLSYRIHHTWTKKQDSLVMSSNFWTSNKLPYNLNAVLKCSANKKMGKLWVERISVARDIASALAYLHEHRVMHRDIKPKNIGFKVGDDSIKLFDFGTAIQIPSDHPSCFVHSGRVGSRRYMAPEVFSRQPYNESADVFSFVLVLWEMLSFSKPPDWNVSPSFEEDVIVKNSQNKDNGNTGSTKSKSMSPLVEGPSHDRPCIPSEWSLGVRGALSLGWSLHPRDRLSAASFVKVLDVEMKRCKQTKADSTRQ